MTTPREKLGLLLGFVGVVLFGGTLPATRIAVAGLDPWFVTTARAALAGAAALTLLVILRRPLPTFAQWKQFAAATFFVTVCFPLFTALAMQTVPAAHGGVVVGIMPIATVVAATVIVGERPSLAFWLAALVGAALVVAYALRHGGADTFAAGDLLLLLAVASGGIGYTLCGRLSLTMPGWEVISWALVVTLLPAVVASILLWPVNAASVPAESWAGLAYVAFMSQWVAFFVWNAGMALAGIARVSQLQLLQTFVTVALAVWVNHEAVDTETIVFAVAVVATVLVGQRMRIAR
jgi:drug/metabolite transporter (DMT)-like permease